MGVVAKGSDDCWLATPIASNGIPTARLVGCFETIPLGGGLHREVLKARIHKTTKHIPILALPLPAQQKEKPD